MIINTGLYEIRLREEFKNMRRLQQDHGMKRILAISFVDRLTGRSISVFDNPESQLYPEQYIISFSMPVFLAKDNLKRDWHGDFTVTLAQDTLMMPESRNVPVYQLDTTNGIPFNHHISQGYFCTGGLWSVAKDYGLWYFIIGCGSIINQESIWMDDRGVGHLNNEAYLYWKNDRRKQKINNIQWPFDLRSRIEIGVRKEIKLNKIKIGQPLQRDMPKIKIIRNN
jgi:hypothetical protein